jgi:hypothetical protein
MTIRERLQELKDAGIPHFISNSSIAYTDIVAQDYSNDDFARIMCRWHDAIRYPQLSGVIPIGIIEIDIPYDKIVDIWILKPSNDMINILPDVIKNKYSHDNFYEDKVYAGGFNYEHPSDKVYRCEVCSRPFKSEQSLLDHMNSEHPTL